MLFVEERGMYFFSVSSVIFVVGFFILTTESTENTEIKPDNPSFGFASNEDDRDFR